MPLSWQEDMYSESSLRIYSLLFAMLLMCLFPSQEDRKWSLDLSHFFAWSFVLRETTWLDVSPSMLLCTRV